MKKFNGVSLIIPAKAAMVEANIVAVSSALILGTTTEGTGKKARTVLKSWPRAQVTHFGTNEKGSDTTHWMYVGGLPTGKPTVEAIEEDVSLRDNCDGTVTLTLAETKTVYTCKADAITIVMDVEDKVKPFSLDSSVVALATKSKAEPEEDDGDEEEAEEKPAKGGKAKAPAKGGKKAEPEPEEDDEVDPEALQEAINELSTADKKDLVESFNEGIDDEDLNITVKQLKDISEFDEDQLALLAELLADDDGEEEAEPEEEDEKPAKGKKAEPAAKGKGGKKAEPEEEEDGELDVEELQEQVNELDAAAKKELVADFNEQIDDEDLNITVKGLKDISDLDEDQLELLASLLGGAVTQESIDELTTAQKKELVAAYNEDADEEITVKSLKDISELDEEALAAAYEAVTGEGEGDGDGEEGEGEDEGVTQETIDELSAADKKKLVAAYNEVAEEEITVKQLKDISELDADQLEAAYNETFGEEEGEDEGSDDGEEDGGDDGEDGDWGDDE